MAGQVARCAGIFCADEVVVIDDSPSSEGGEKTVSSHAAFLARVLQYMETPQYLRRSLIAQHPHLKHVGLLPPLNAPHHPRSTEWTKYREGVVERVAASTSGADAEPDHSLVNVGLDRPAKVHRALSVGERVTVRMKDKGFPKAGDEAAAGDGGGGGEWYRGKVVDSREPRRRKGSFWGYSVRLARTLSEALEGGDREYDLKIGTSERGEVFDPTRPDCSLPEFSSLLVCFGAVEGLERAYAGDPKLKSREGGCEQLFDLWLNTCPSQGTRTIRAEEAILVSMALLSTKLPRFFSENAVNATVGGGGGNDAEE